MPRAPLPNEMLRQLGAPETIDAVCRAAHIERNEFLERWPATAAARVPSMSGRYSAPVGRPVEIERDCWGVPHIYAERIEDLYVGFGYAMAQDRLFQLDWLRRKGAGRLAEILGNDGVAQDVVARTVGLNRIARDAWKNASTETQKLLTAFSTGINTLIEQSGDNLPIEFGLLDYRPEPWQPVDCLLIEYEFIWYLTGRFPVLAIPELARRSLADDALYRAFLTAEFDDECILQSGEYPGRTDGGGSERVGTAVGDPDGDIGSNNWVVDGRRSASGKPVVASDPHIAIEAVSCWYEVHLQGGTDGGGEAIDVAGCAYVGMPAILIGRNRRVAWGITNDICSLRDLYQEQTSADHPGCYFNDGRWEPARELTELIHVRDFGPISKQVRFSHNGPIVDEILPPPANHRAGPVSLKWLGAYHGGWLTALFAMNRARDCDSFREAMRPWHAPTFSMVFADVDGNIGYQAAGRIPIRERPERGYRRGWDPADRWQGLIPFENMPALANPQRGFVATANNRVAADDFPYPLSGTWASGDRARRIRELIESHPVLGTEDHRRFQQDARSLRAVNCLPALCATLANDADVTVRHVTELLANWNGDCHADLVAPAVFNVFFVDWCKRVVSEHFGADAVPLLSGGMDGLAARLVQGDDCGWFKKHDREAMIRATLRGTLDRLATRMGRDPAGWTWGRLHRLDPKHVLGGRGDLGPLLNQTGAGVRGDTTTVCNTGRGADFEAASGAGYRMICDLGEEPAGLWAVDCQSQSGHPGSPHYADQFQTWLTGEYHFIPLDRSEALKAVATTLRLVPEPH